jgi:hypothetical protein
LPRRISELKRSERRLGHILSAHSNEGMWEGRNMQHAWVTSKYMQWFYLKTSSDEKIWEYKRKCLDNIKLNLDGLGWEVIDCIYLAQDKTGISFLRADNIKYFGLGKANILTGWVEVCFSIRTLLGALSRIASLICFHPFILKNAVSLIT